MKTISEEVELKIAIKHLEPVSEEWKQHDDGPENRLGTGDPSSPLSPSAYLFSFFLKHSRNLL
ncbi:MAG: hypothetical protein ACXAB4_05465 [Candidatus Hodarchaeales archaeon]|jgi:hypothetical protein